MLVHLSLDFVLYHALGGKRIYIYNIYIKREKERERERENESEWEREWERERDKSG